jgi:cyclopropane fatty-acyl-phospholipid synthase-like methyltransferase
MSRILTKPNDKDKPRIDRQSVLDFFDVRASKYSNLGPVSTVIYQDKNPTLAIKRDSVEKSFLLDKLKLTPSSRVLDIGCGTGRWADTIVPSGAYYHGIDSSIGLIECARNRYKNNINVKFSQIPIDTLNLDKISEHSPFNIILCFGLFIYLNDDEVLTALENIQYIAAEKTRVVIREPVGLNFRLTLKNHFSKDMEQYYNAIYRTFDELHAMIESKLLCNGFNLGDHGQLFSDNSLNNRAETIQYWILLDR